jgi:hypothetical protein
MHAQTVTDTDRHRQTHTYTDRYRRAHTDTYMHRQSQRDTDRQRQTHTDMHIHRQTLHRQRLGEHVGHGFQQLLWNVGAVLNDVVDDVNEQLLVAAHPREVGQSQDL